MMYLWKSWLAEQSLKVAVVAVVVVVAVQQLLELYWSHSTPWISLACLLNVLHKIHPTCVMPVVYGIILFARGYHLLDGSAYYCPQNQLVLPAAVLGQSWAGLDSFVHCAICSDLRRPAVSLRSVGEFVRLLVCLSVICCDVLQLCNLRIVRKLF